MNWNIKFDNSGSSALPLYMQVADTLRKMINNGLLLPGEKLPSARELRQYFGVSVITIENGIKELVNEQYLSRKPRLGTIVNATPGPGSMQTKQLPAEGAIRIIFCDIHPDDFYWYVVLNALEKSPAVRDYEKMFSCLDSRDLGPEKIKKLRQNCVGAILCGYIPIELCEEFIRINFPFALVGGFNSDHATGFTVDAVVHDDVQRAYLSTRHLLELKHKQICCVAGPPDSKLADDTFTGYRNAMTEYGIDQNDFMFEIAREHTIEEGQHIGVRILTQVPRPSAVFACDDRLAAGVAKAANLLGFRLPDELSLIGGGNLSIGKIISPELTSTPSYPEKSAELAIAKLLNQLRNPNCVKTKTVLEIENISIGGSTKFFRSQQN